MENTQINLEITEPIGGYQNMKFRQNNDTGSCRMIFSDEEIKILNEKKELYFDSESLKHIGNCLVKIVSDWNMNFNPEVADKETLSDAKEIKGK